jgi:hypothetical protein
MSALFQMNDFSILASINENNTYYRPFLMLKNVTDLQAGCGRKFCPVGKFCPVIACANDV